MSKKIVLVLLMLSCLTALNICAGERFTLVIDAGHGGHDPGAKGKYSYEKTINLNVTLAFGRYVEKHCPDVRVVYTRKTDKFVPLHKRASIANKNKADVFISIHTNALPKGKIARGFETYTMGMRRSDEKLSAAKRENSVIMIEDNYQQHYEGFDPNSPESTIMFEFMHDTNMEQSVELARCVQNQVCANTNRLNKGVKQDVFLVLRETSMPACLVELGFITTPDEESYLSKKENQDVLGYHLYKAFVRYKNKCSAHSVKNETRETESREPQAPVRKERQSADVAADEAADRPQTVTKPETKVAAQDAKPAVGESQKDNGCPIFKVQLVASRNVLKSDSGAFKGLTGIGCYQEGGFNKYTYGASANYNEISRLRKSILDKFPQAFIVAFKNGEKMNVQDAIREFKANRK